MEGQPIQTDKDEKDVGNKKFSLELWDCFEKVFDRVTKGRHDLKLFKKYVEERGVNEEVYGRALEKFAKLQEFEEEGSLTKTFSDVKDAAIQIGKQHVQFGIVNAEIASTLDKMIVEIKTTKTRLSLNFQKLTKEEKNRSTIHQKCKQQYIDAMKQAEAATIALKDGKKANQPKAIDKLEKNERASIKNLDQCHNAYKKAVESLKQIQEQLHKETAQMLEEFEKLEYRRMECVKEQLDKFVSRHEFLKNSLEQTTIFLKKSVDSVRIRKDVQEYIAKTTTGKEPGPYVEYTPIYSQILGGDYAGPTNPEMKKEIPSNNQFGTSLQPVASIPPPAAPVHQPNNHLSSSFSHEEKPSEPMAQGLYDFDTQEPDELPFKAGDMIKLYSYPPDNDWWQGELNGRTGIFPKDYVQIVTHSSSANVQASSSSPSSEAAQLPSTPSPQVEGEGSSSVSQDYNQYNSLAPSSSAASSNFASPSIGTTVTPSSSSPAPSSSQNQNATTATNGAADALKIMDATCEALYDFEAQGADELSFVAGDTLIITGELNGWYLGKSVDGKRVGIFPSNYVTVKSN